MEVIHQGPPLGWHWGAILQVIERSQERRMRNPCSDQFTLGMIGPACIIGLLMVTGAPARAAPLLSPIARMELPFTLLKIVQEQELAYARAAARGPRGGAVARGPRGTVARGPHGGGAARGGRSRGRGAAAGGGCS